MSEFDKKNKEDKNEKSSSKKQEKVMPFLEHLDELRSCLLKSIATVFIATIICYFFSQEIMSFLIAPFPEKLIFLAPTESFIVHIKVSLFAGIFLSLPILFYHLWHFVVPGLLDKEKKFVPMIVFFSTLFFLIGSAFCYFVIIPFGLKFLLGWQTENLVPTIAIREYLKFVTLLVIVFGIIFELPLLAYFLTKMGILTPVFLSKNRRYGIVIIFILAAILTPPDFVTQIFLAGPLILLYEISILVSKAVYKIPEDETVSS